MILLSMRKLKSVSHMLYGSILFEDMTKYDCHCLFEPLLLIQIILFGSSDASLTPEEREEKEKRAAFVQELVMSSLFDD